MQSVIVNCCKIILVSLVLVSCGKSKEDEKLFEEMNLAFEHSNKAIKKQTEGYLRKLESDLQKVATRDKASIWLAKAKLADELSNEPIAYLDFLQQQIKGGKFLDSFEIKKLYYYLISYKQKILQIDDRIKVELGTAISLTNYKKDSSEMTASEFCSSFNTSNSFIKTVLLRNRIQIVNENIIEYCSLNIGGCILQYEAYQAIAYQNSTHFKRKETLQITAGIGAFTNDINSKVRVNGKEVKLNDEGVAEFRETVPSKTGVYHKKISLQYTKPDGTISTVEKEIIYTVDE